MRLNEFADIKGRRQNKKAVKQAMKAEYEHVLQAWQGWIQGMGRKEVKSLTLDEIMQFFQTQNYEASASEIIEPLVAKLDQKQELPGEEGTDLEEPGEDELNMDDGLDDAESSSSTPSPAQRESRDAITEGILSGTPKNPEAAAVFKKIKPIIKQIIQRAVKKNSQAVVSVAQDRDEMDNMVPDKGTRPEGASRTDTKLPQPIKKAILNALDNLDKNDKRQYGQEIKNFAKRHLQ